MKGIRKWRHDVGLPKTYETYLTLVTTYNKIILAQVA